MNNWKGDTWYLYQLENANPGWKVTLAKLVIAKDLSGKVMVCKEFNFKRWGWKVEALLDIFE